MPVSQIKIYANWLVKQVGGEDESTGGVGAINMTNTNFRIIILKSSYTPNIATDAVISDIAVHEVQSGSTYTRSDASNIGGFLLDPSVQISLDVNINFKRFDNAPPFVAPDPTGFTDARYWVICKAFPTTNPEDAPLIAYGDFLTEQSIQERNLVIEISDDFTFNFGRPYIRLPAQPENP